MYLILGGSFVYYLLVESRQSTDFPLERHRPTSRSLAQVKRSYLTSLKNEECYDILILVHNFNSNMQPNILVILPNSPRKVRATFLSLI